MKYQVEILPKTHEDIEGFFKFLKQNFVENNILLKFRNLIYYKIYSLEYFPEIFPEVYKNYRRLLIKDYSIFYKVNKKEKRVIIHRFLHQSQDFKNHIK